MKIVTSFHSIPLQSIPFHPIRYLAIALIIPTVMIKTFQPHGIQLNIQQVMQLDMNRKK